MLENLSNLQHTLRLERNVRIHRAERAEQESLTGDDQTFKTAAIFSHYGNGVTGEDRLGRPIDLNRFYREAADYLRTKFNSNVKILESALDEFYPPLLLEFNTRFRSKSRQEGLFMKISHAK